MDIHDVKNTSTLEHELHYTHMNVTRVNVSLHCSGIGEVGVSDSLFLQKSSILPFLFLVRYDLMLPYLT